MRLYTIVIASATLVLLAVALSTHTLSWSGIGNNLIAGLIMVPVTVTLVGWIIERDRKRLDGLWASEALFMPLIDVRLLILQGARFVLADDPPGVEAPEHWMTIAEELAHKRVQLSALFTREILLAVVELENELRRVASVTARGAESRKEYARDLLGLWGRFFSLMDRMLPAGDEVRKDLLVRPKELVNIQERYNWTEHGIDRDEDAALTRALEKSK